MKFISKLFLFGNLFGVASSLVLAGASAFGYKSAPITAGDYIIDCFQCATTAAVIWWLLRQAK